MAKSAFPPGPDLQAGDTVARCDSHSKVTGLARFAADEYPEGLLFAGVKRALVPHGLLRTLNSARTLQEPGVVAVLTARDISGSNRQGIIHKDQPVLIEDRVRHRGDALALVLAESRESLEKGLDLIEARIDPLPGVFDPEEALKEDAPKIHEKGNLLCHALIEKGSAEKALESCDVVVEDVFAVPFQDHAFLETQNGIAQMGADGGVTLTVSTQAPFRDRFEIAHALGLDVGAIRVVSPYLGGGFGGKDGATVQCFLALAALHSKGRPVKMWWSREESFLAGYKRHAARMRFRLGARKDGTFEALSAIFHFDAGPYAHLSVEVMELGMEHAAGPYRIPHTHLEGYCVYTNNPIGGAMRGFGITQATFGIERMVDLLAARLGIDPLELRLKNAVRRGDLNGAGVALGHSTGIIPCLEVLRSHPLWVSRHEWKAQAGLFTKRGTGIAAVSNAIGYGRGLPDAASAKVELKSDGRFLIYSGVPDMGQGNAAAYVQIAGEILCQTAGTIEIVQPDTALSLPSGSSSASRTVFTFGNAMIKVCESIRKRLLIWACQFLLVDDVATLVLLPGRIRHAPSGREIPLRLLAQFFSPQDRTFVESYVMPVARDAPDTGKEFPLGFPHTIFSYGAHLVRVEVDVLTGKANVLDYVAVTDGGRILNPQGFEQQIHGGVAQGLGYALMEEILLSEGRILNPDFTTYLIPSTMDVPDIHSDAIQTTEKEGPFGMKGVGEIGTLGPLPAVSAAVEDAVGHRLNQSPLTPPRILEVIRT